MAENKKSFLLYCDFIHIFEELSDEEAGKLIKHVFDYVNDKHPETNDKLIKIAFQPIKHALKRDLEKYEDVRERNKENAKMRWHKKKCENMRPHATACDSMPNDTKNADNVSDSDNDSDNVIESDNIAHAEEKKSFLPTEEEKEKNVAPKKEKNQNDITRSNLFRKPTIPIYKEVERTFISNGGSPQMAEAFFNKYSATGWYIGTSPITNYTNLIPSYIRNWIDNEKNKRTSAKVTAGHPAAIIDGL